MEIDDTEKKTEMKWRDKCPEGLLAIVSILTIGKYVCPFPLPRGVEIQNCKRKDDSSPNLPISFKWMFYKNKLYLDGKLHANFQGKSLISDSAIPTNISALDIPCLDSSSYQLTFDFSILLILPYVVWIGRHIC